MSEKDSYETNRLQPLEAVETTDESKAEAAIMNQPEGVREELRKAWLEYKRNLNMSVTSRTFIGDGAVNLIHDKFFSEALAGKNPDYEQIHTQFIQDTRSGHYAGEATSANRVTQPVAGVDLTRRNADAMIIEQGEDRKI